MERWEPLKEGGYRLLEDGGATPLGMDAFLLAAFPKLRRGTRACDLCSGSGAVSLLLFQHCADLRVTSVEIREEAVRSAERTAGANGLTDRWTLCRGDLRQIRTLPGAGSFDLVVCDPPYYRPSDGPLPRDPARAAARTETDCTIEDVCRAAAWLLRWDGSFCLVHRPERLTDLLCSARAAGLEPKRSRTVCRRAGDPPSLLLLECRRGGRPGLRWEPPLILESRPGAEELDKIYFRRGRDAT